MANPTRRAFLGSAGNLAIAAAIGATSPRRTALAQPSWDAGLVAHLIPAASHDRILIKSSFVEPLQVPPRLVVDDRSLSGHRTDSAGRFWHFDVPGLAPDTSHALRIVDAAGEPLCDPWPLRTFPAPDATRDRCRLLVFTCSGGYDRVSLGFESIFLDMEARRRLLARALSFKPDALIANGDMIYWDMETSQNKGFLLAMLAQFVWMTTGYLNFDAPMSDAGNERILQDIADYQIASLYGTSLRSVPSFFLTDDHDLFENDEATPELVTLPPTPARIAAARAIQHWYYPEFLPDRHRPMTLPGSAAPDRAPGLSECFGTLRYGRLLETVLYDTKRHAALDGDTAGMVPDAVEAWLKARTAAANTAHLVHVPSTPFGWSAGKFGEWYPDLLSDDGVLDTLAPKPYWPGGWWHQHQRIVEMLAAQRHRLPLVLQGDLHAVGYGVMERSGSLDLRSNPVHLALTGPLGTGDLAFPSAVRDTPPRPSSLVQLDASIPPLEKNGFTIADFTPDEVVLQIFAWRPPDPVDAIDELAPVFVQRIGRRG